MAMGVEKPDLSRQSKAFKGVHTGLAAEQIAVPRSQIRMCSASDLVSKVRARNRDPTFDYLPVHDADGHLIGLLSNHAIDDAGSGGGGGGGDSQVGEHMDPLSEADLIGAETPITALIGRVRQKPFLVISAQAIIGMVAWSDLQKLPVRAALFALVTGLELTMYETIKRHFGKREDWTLHLAQGRLNRAEKEYRDQCERGSDVDLLLCTQFCDKRDILIKSFEFAIEKRKLERKCKAIEQIRNDVAHANNYAMSFEQVEQLRAMLRDLGELRSQVKSLVR
ncbi:hypothetical protein [Candidatus Palauibacter sp.]|uniref:hypothetical protein n=1 Tax=Candidatus Palauibacter sp. TaxID=3101350 RepID=UPI003B5AC710